MLITNNPITIALYLHSVQTLLFQGDGFKYAHSFSINHPLIAEQINIDTQGLSSGTPQLLAMGIWEI